VTLSKELHETAGSADEEMQHGGHFAIQFTGMLTKSKLLQPSILLANHIIPMSLSNSAGYSNSTVPGGLLVMSTTTLVTPCDLGQYYKFRKRKMKRYLVWEQYNSPRTSI
jgi:hypothetical protein